MIRRLISSAALFCGVSALELGKVTRSTQYGDVIGKHEVIGLDLFNTIDIFHSIPFAAPPVGDLRFHAPVAPTPWSEALDASELGHQCPQFDIKIGYIGHEDCLTLNVYVPKSASAKNPLPVLFYIFGGAYILGDGFEFGIYDATDLASKHDVIVVVPNYRTGPLGFLAHPHLQSEHPSGATGNFGIQDQRFAMQWVQDNIKNFYGDPSRVTIWGESAGAFSVCLHLGNGFHSGLFHAAIMDSGSCDSKELLFPLTTAFNYGELYAEKQGCNSTDAAEFRSCLRSKSLHDAMQSLVLPAGSDPSLYPSLAPVIPWSPVQDGSPDGMPELPLVSMRNGRANKVPVMHGSNLNEGSIFVPLIPLMVPGTHYPQQLGDFELLLKHVTSTGTNGSTIDIQPMVNAYASESFKSEMERNSMLIRDFLFLCPARRSVRAVVAAGQPAFLYQFAYLNEWIDEVLIGAYHASELAWIFGNSWPSPLVHGFITPADFRVRDVMSQYWTNFAKYHNPNGQGNDAVAAKNAWPAYDSLDLNVHLDDPITVTQALQAARCDVLDAYVGL